MKNKKFYFDSKSLTVLGLMSELLDITVAKAKYKQIKN